MSVLNNHFPPPIYNRFELRADSEIFKASEDEGTWSRQRSDSEHIHILFDGLEIIEITSQVKREWLEWFVLRAFRDAIDEGRIYIDKVLEWTDNETAKRNKKALEDNKKKKVQEAFKFARDNRFDIQRIEAKLPRAGKSKKGRTVKKFELGGGEK